MEKKMIVPIEKLCQTLPIQISAFQNYVHSLQFEDKPDYRFLRKTLRELFFQQNYDWDYAYDWTIPVDKHGKARKNLEYTTHFIKISVNFNPDEQKLNE